MRPTDLRDFDRVGQADPEMVAVGGDEHLRLVAQAAEGDRMDDAVAVALEDVARASRAADHPPRWALPRDRLGARRGGAGSVIRVGSFSIVWAGGRVQLKPSTPTLSSSLTKACASDGLGNGPISSRK